MKNDKQEKRFRSEHFKDKISDARLLMGSVTEKFPVILDDGKTIIYITDKSKEEETRQKYELLKRSRFPNAIENRPNLTSH